MMNVKLDENCALCEGDRKAYNANVANGLILEARVILRRLEAHAVGHSR